MTGSIHEIRDDSLRRRAAWALPLLPIALSGFLLSALTWLRLRGGPAPGDQGLAGLVVWLHDVFGFEPLFMVAVLTLAWSSIRFLGGDLERPLSRVGRVALHGLCLAILVNLRIDGTLPAGAGEIGAWFAGRLVDVFGPVFSILVVSVASLASLVLATDFFFYRYFEELAERSRNAGRSGAPGAVAAGATGAVATGAVAAGMGATGFHVGGGEDAAPASAVPPEGADLTAPEDQSGVEDEAVEALKALSLAPGTTQPAALADLDDRAGAVARAVEERSDPEVADPEGTDPEGTEAEPVAEAASGPVDLDEAYRARLVEERGSRRLSWRERRAIREAGRAGGDPEQEVQAEVVMQPGEGLEVRPMQPVEEPVDEAAAETVAEIVAEPVPESVAEPVPEPIAEPAANVVAPSGPTDGEASHAEEAEAEPPFGGDDALVEDPDGETELYAVAEDAEADAWSAGATGGAEVSAEEEASASAPWPEEVDAEVAADAELSAEAEDPESEEWAEEEPEEVAEDAELSAEEEDPETEEWSEEESAESVEDAELSAEAEDPESEEWSEEESDESVEDAELSAEEEDPETEEWSEEESEEAVEDAELSAEAEDPESEEWSEEESDEAVEDAELSAEAEDPETEEWSEEESEEAAEDAELSADAEEPQPEITAEEVAEASEAADRGVETTSAETAEESTVVLQPVAAEDADARQQRSLFPIGPGDDDLLAEAKDLVVEYRRASRNFLRRRLRVSNEEAEDLLVELARRGVVSYRRGDSQGRVLVESA